MAAAEAVRTGLTIFDKVKKEARLNYQPGF
jgi:hypothetical protein